MHCILFAEIQKNGLWRTKPLVKFYLDTLTSEPSPMHPTPHLRHKSHKKNRRRRHRTGVIGKTSGGNSPLRMLIGGVQGQALHGTITVGTIGTPAVGTIGTPAAVRTRGARTVGTTAVAGTRGARTVGATAVGTGGGRPAVKQIQQKLTMMPTCFHRGRHRV